jgi:hypothetical protein
MMETDTIKAYDNFMKTTGFSNSNKVPKEADMPPMSQGKSVQQFSSHYDRSNPSAQPTVPGQVGQMVPNGEITPNNGLVPGRMPLKDQLNPTLVSQHDPYPTSDLLGKVPFTAGRPATRQDWRATNLGPESDRNAPGDIALSPPDQGRLTPPFTGEYDVVAKLPDGPFPKPSKWEKMIAGNYIYAVYIFGAATIVAAGMWAREKGEMWAIVALVCGAITASMMAKNKTENNTASKERRSENLSVDRDQVKYDSNPEVGPTDTSLKQVYRPRKDSEPDPNPYPKPLDSQTDTNARLAAQGLDQSNVEGPRSDYWYKRGPTPANRKRVTDKNLMRSAKQYNMNERDLAEYMARLDGEAPDQFYQAHPYMPFSANWEHRQNIADTDTIHGITTEPGSFNRKWAYRDPKIQHAGAKTMHTKEPPPGSDLYLDKVHPWMEPKDQVYSKPFDADQYTEFMSGDVGSSSRHGLHETKVSAQDAGRISSGRQQEDEYYRNMYGAAHKDPDDLPPGLEPVPTSRDSIGKQMLERKQKNAMQMANQTDRQINYMQNAQGYGYKAVPPHPSSPQQVPPNMYENNPPYPINYAAPNQMPSPNLRPRPQRDTVATPPGPGPVSLKEKTEKEFASAFADNAPDDALIQEAIKGGKRR